MMNARMVSFWDRAVEVGVLLLAFLLPVAFYLKTYDSAMVKELTLQAGGALLVILAVMRQIEAGRFELAKPRSWLAALATLLLLWIAISYARNPLPEVSLFGTLRLCLFAALFIVVFTGPASVSFADRLSKWTLGAAAVASVYAVVQYAGLDPLIVWKLAFEEQSFSTLAAPDLLGVFLGASFPIALAVWADPEGSWLGRSVGAVVALLCAVGVVTAGTHEGLAAFSAGALVFAVIAWLRSRDLSTRSVGLAAAAAIPSVIWSMFLVGGGGLEARLLRKWAVYSEIWSGTKAMISDHLWTGVGAGMFQAAYVPYRPARLLELEGSHNYLATGAHSAPLEAAAELGLIGFLLWAGLFVAVLLISWREIARRSGEGEVRASSVMMGQYAALVALLAGGSVGLSLQFPAPGALLWLLAASLAGLSLERGAATVHVLPIPAPPAVRRVLYAPLAGVMIFSLVWQARFFRSDMTHNSGIYYAKRDKWDDAIKRFSAVSPWHSNGVMAGYFLGNVHLERGGQDDLREALARYEEVERIFPHYVQVDFQKAAAYQKLGEWEKAEESLLAYAKIDPDFPPTYRRLAEVSPLVGKPEQARWAALQLVRIDPEDPKNWRFLAEQFHSQRRFRTARLMFDKAKRVQDLASARNGSNSIH